MKKKIYLLLFFCSFSILSFAQNSLDYRLVKQANQSGNPQSDRFWKNTSDATYIMAIGTPLTTLSVGLLKKDKNLQQKSYEMGVSVLAAGGSTYILKKIFNRNRPYIDHADIEAKVIENSSSFPSGHTSIAFATATTLTLNFPKWYVAVPAYGFASAVGYSRVYLGVHYPSDVLGGAALGFGSAWLTHKGNQWLQRQKKKNL